MTVQFPISYGPPVAHTVALMVFRIQKKKSKKTRRVTRGIFFSRASTERLWANHQVGGQPSLSPHNITYRSRRRITRKRHGPRVGCSSVHASAADCTVKKHLLSAATVADDDHGRGGVTSYRTHTFGGARVGPSASTHRTERPVDSARQSSRRLVASVVPRPLIRYSRRPTGAIAGARVCACSACVPPYMSVSVRNNYTVIFCTHARATRAR